MSSTQRPLVIAHRGASVDAPENTRSAFVQAAEQGADWVELDVRLAADRSLIVNHDAWYRDGRTVWSTPRAEAPEATIDLSEAMRVCRGEASTVMGVNVEIKNSPGDLADAPYGLDVVDSVLEVIEPYVSDDPTSVLVSSFDMATIDRVKELDAEILTGYLVFDLNAQPDALEHTAERGHDAFHPWGPFVTEQMIARCRERELILNTWTIDEAPRWAELADWGVDGIVTNLPGRLVQAMAGTRWT